MIGRILRGGGQVGLKKVRLGVAAAVLVGGGAAGVAAVATSSQSPVTPSTQNAAFALGYRHILGMGYSLNKAMSMWPKSHSLALNTLANMVQLRTFIQVPQQGTMVAAQRGVAVAVTPQMLVVQSADQQRHLWWLNGNTQFVNVTSSVSGMVAMMGNNRAAYGALSHNFGTATSWMAGGSGSMWEMTHNSKPMIIRTGSKMVNVTVGSRMTKVTQRPVNNAGPATTTSMPTTTTVQGLAQNDFVFVVGVRQNGMLIAKLVLFVAQPNNMATNSATATNSASTSASATGSATPTNSGSTSASANPTTSAPTSPAPSSSAPTSPAPSSSAPTTPAQTSSSPAPHPSDTTSFNSHF